MSLEKDQDFADIIALQKEGSPYRRYFLRRLREKKDIISSEVLRKNGISPEERERLRAKFLAYEEIEAMLDNDERVMRTAQANAPVSGS